MSGRPPPERARSDARMSRLVALVLRGGVLLAAAVTAVGGLGLLVRHGGEVPDYRVFRGEEAPYRTVAEIARGVEDFSMPAIISLGIVLLIATPVARVMLTLGGFIAQRDRVYIAITGLVLLILASSLLFGGRL